MSAIVPQPISMLRAIRHLCVSDLRRFHWLVSGVIGVELVRALLVEGSIHLTPPTTMGSLPQAGAEVAIPLLDVAITVLIAIVTAILVQADHPTDDRAFWRTRPIPPLAMGAAKALSLTLLFVVLPAAINAVRLVAYHAPASAIGAATLQIAVQAGVVCVPAWFLAVATRTLPRFLGGVLGAIIVAYFVVGAVVAVVGFVSRSLARTSLGVAPPIFDWQHTGLHGWWSGLISTIVGVAILVADYAIRRMKVTVAGLLLLVLIPSLVPPRVSEFPAAADLASRVGGPLGLDNGLRATAGARGGPYRPPNVYIVGRIAVPPLPPDVSAAVRVDRIGVRAGGVAVPAEGTEQCCVGAGAIGVVSPLLPSWRNQHWTQSSGGGDAPAVFTVPSQAFDMLRRGPIALDADATILFTRYRVAGTLPLRPGSSLRTDRYLIEVLAVEGFGPTLVGGATVLVRFLRFPSLSDTGPQLDLLLTDRGRQSVSRVFSPWPIATHNPGTTVDNWSRGRTWVGRYSFQLSGRDPRVPATDLVVVESAGAGTAHATLQATDVPIQFGPSY